MSISDNILQSIRNIIFSANYVLLTPAIQNKQISSQLYSNNQTNQVENNSNLVINFYIHNDTTIKYIKIPDRITDEYHDIIKLKYLNIMGRFISDFLPNINNFNIIDNQWKQIWRELFNNSKNALSDLVDNITEIRQNNFYYYSNKDLFNTISIKQRKIYKKLLNELDSEYDKYYNNIALLIQDYNNKVIKSNITIQQFAITDNINIIDSSYLFKFNFYNKEDIQNLQLNANENPDTETDSDTTDTDSDTDDEKKKKKIYINMTSFEDYQNEYKDNKTLHTEIPIKITLNKTSTDISYSTIHDKHNIHLVRVMLNINNDGTYAFRKQKTKTILSNLFDEYNKNPNDKSIVNNIKEKYKELQNFIDNKYIEFYGNPPKGINTEFRNKYNRYPLLLTDTQYQTLKNIKEFWLEDNHLEVEFVPNKFKKAFRFITLNSTTDNIGSSVKAIRLNNGSDIRWAIWKPINKDDTIEDIVLRFTLLGKINYFPSYLLPYYIGNTSSLQPKFFNISILWLFNKYSEYPNYPTINVSLYPMLTKKPITSKKIKTSVTLPTTTDLTIKIRKHPLDLYSTSPGSYKPHPAVQEFLFRLYKKPNKDNINLNAVVSHKPKDIINLFSTYLSIYDKIPLSAKGGEGDIVLNLNKSNNIVQRLINNIKFKLYRSLNFGVLSSQFNSFQSYLEYIIMNSNRNPIHLIDLISQIYKVNILLFKVNFNSSNNMKISCFAYKNFDNTLVIQMDSDNILSIICPKTGTKGKTVKFYCHFNNEVSKNTGFKLDHKYIQNQCKQNNIPLSLNAWKHIPTLSELQNTVIGKTWSIGYLVIGQNNYITGALIHLRSDKNNKVSKKYLYVPIQYFNNTSKYDKVEIQNNQFYFNQDKIILFSCDQTIKHYNTYFKDLKGLQIRFKFQNYLLLECGEFVYTSTTCGSIDTPYVKTMANELNKPSLKFKDTINIKNIKEYNIQKFIMNEYTKRYYGAIDNQNNHYKLNSTFHILDKTNNSYKFSSGINYKTPVPYIKQFNDTPINEVVNTPIVNYDALLSLLPHQEAWNAHTAELDLV